jgi:hypothetical protein
MGHSILFVGALTIVVHVSSAPSPWQAPISGQASSPPAAAAALDYETFKAKVQPILTSPRKGNARCLSCHSRGGGNAFLEPLAPGTTTYTEEQSRRNFERVSRLVVPGEPLKSILLTTPLAQEAGGSHWHGGGKHWASPENPEWQTLAAWVQARSTPASRAKAGLSYDVFKTKVQPILISSRKGNARCLSCHSRGGGNAFLEPLAPGTTTYTEEQSQRNFERVSRLVVPGEPLKSILLTNPLAQEAGGSHWHGGGKHWASPDNAEWQTLAAWVRGS